MKSISKVPMWIKIAFTAYMAVHFYVNFRVSGWWNFLWFCDIAVIVTVVGMWRESRLLISIAAVSILIPLSLWSVDLAWRLALGRGHYLFGFAGYMFDRHNPRLLRLISTFHLWLPLLLLWLLFKFGYDRRALLIQTIFSIFLHLLCRTISYPPPKTAEHPEPNINWVFGTSDDAPQTYMPGWLYITILTTCYPLVIYVPTHFLLAYFFNPNRKRAAAESMPPQLSRELTS